MKNKVDIITSNGYKKEGYGLLDAALISKYKKVTENNTHWITLLDNDSLQMYAYFTEDSECEKEYDTGIVNVSGDELEILIKVLVNNHF
jgi:hypothetical protein